MIGLLNVPMEHKSRRINKGHRILAFTTGIHSSRIYQWKTEPLNVPTVHIALEYYQWNTELFDLLMLLKLPKEYATTGLTNDRHSSWITKAIHSSLVY